MIGPAGGRRGVLALVWALTLLAGPAVRAQTRWPADTLAAGAVPPTRPLRPDSLRVFTPGRLHRLTGSPAFRRTVVPATLLTLAVLGTEKVDVFETDEALRREVTARVHLQTSLDDQLRHVPALASLGLSLVGVKGRHNTLNQALLFGLTYTINNTLTSNLKQLTHVERPQGNSFDSFPSQHTSAAFSAARLLDKEYGGRSGWYRVGGYTVATATGALRIAKDNHWLSDVLAGAGVGLLSTELAYWVYPWLHRQLVKGLGDRAVVLPLYLDGSVGVTAVVLL
ncbi:phosphatase PAP2 family protein [Hymenobacter properus]|uniref:Phosphatase PAP2 family protein n=1 Tax=Hymenobacter properus TaxID=2791026 RepID=A0A931FNU6_9BACT|nr:phosphatase PAP2 family protein [Hymenobacter properus]MBF9144541.1 phosphatase PAP2 family protein [Hymenobacter properus]MBR7723359.1 phosphatase PAP2 family protein [Microvirga sp. SRT04]